MKAICKITGCEEPMHARGWCTLHYNRWWRTAQPEIDGRFQPGVQQIPLYVSRSSPIARQQRRFDTLMTAYCNHPTHRKDRNGR